MNLLLFATNYFDLYSLFSLLYERFVCYFYLLIHFLQGGSFSI